MFQRAGLSCRVKEMGGLSLILLGKLLAIECVFE
jgi:hypothetical protein